MDTTQIETPDGLQLDATIQSADGDAVGAVLLAHGITRDKTEGGMFDALAERLTGAGFDVVRFSYRGHGASDGHSSGMTIAGERLDFRTAFEYAMDRFDGPYFVVAKSFGAVSTSLSLEYYADDIAGVVLWNPVLDVEGTFLDPDLPWGVEHFTGDALEELETTGTLPIHDGEFHMGRVLYDELHRYDPGAHFVESDVPALVVHGDADEIVPYEDARRVAERKGADFHTIEGADHGFVTEHGPAGDREHDRVTTEWLLDHLPA